MGKVTEQLRIWCIFTKSKYKYNKYLEIKTLVVVKLRRSKTMINIKHKVIVLGAADMEGPVWKEHKGSFNSMADVLLLSFCCFLAYVLHILFYVYKYFTVRKNENHRILVSCTSSTKCLSIRKLGASLWRVPGFTHLRISSSQHSAGAQ